MTDGRAVRNLCAVAVAGAALTLAGAGGSPDAEVGISAPLRIEAPPQAGVGQPLLVRVEDDSAVNGSPAVLAFIGTSGLRLYDGQFTAGILQLRIPEADTEQAGRATLVATSGLQRAVTFVDVVAEAPAEPVFAIVGSRSSVADGSHWCMAVVIANDRLGNAVASGTRVDLHVVHPGGVHEDIEASVQHQLAWARIFTRTRAGRSVVTATSGGMHGPESSFEEIPGWPSSMSLSSSSPTATPDGRQLIALRTGTLIDRHGNVMLDGTLITFVGRSTDAALRIIPAYTIDGVAKTLLQAPRVPAHTDVVAEVYGAASAPYTLSFQGGPAVGTFPIEVQVDRARQAVILKMGPLLGPLDQFVADGLPVRAELYNTAGKVLSITAIAEGGYAEASVRLRGLEPGDYRVEVELGDGRGFATFSVD